MMCKNASCIAAVAKQHHRCHPDHADLAWLLLFCCIYSAGISLESTMSAIERMKALKAEGDFSSTKTLPMCDSVTNEPLHSRSTGRRSAASAKSDIEAQMQRQQNDENLVVESGRCNAAAAAAAAAAEAPAATRPPGTARTVRFNLASEAATSSAGRNSLAGTFTLEPKTPRRAFNALTLRSARSMRRLGLSVSSSVRSFASKKFGSMRFSLLDVMEAEYELQQQQQQQRQQQQRQQQQQQPGVSAGGVQQAPTSMMPHTPHPYGGATPAMFSVQESIPEVEDAGTEGGGSSSAAQGGTAAGSAAAAAAGTVQAGKVLSKDQHLPAKQPQHLGSARDLGDTADAHAAVITIPSLTRTAGATGDGAAADTTLAKDAQHAGVTAAPAATGGPQKQAECGMQNEYSRVDSLEGPFGHAASEPFGVPPGPALLPSSSNASAKRHQEKKGKKQEFAAAASGAGSGMKAGSAASASSKRISFVKRELPSSGSKHY
jgi:hypothetical protein